VRHVEPNPTTGCAAALLDLGVRGECNTVARGQLHPLGVVTLHEPFPEVVPKNPALAAGSLRDQRARRVFGFDETRGVELDQLGIADPPTRLDGETEGVAGVLVAP
jgi:hypothetical protein